MGREQLLSVLVVLLSGLSLQIVAWLPPRHLSGASGAELERRAWLRLWGPAVPALWVAAWLGGWALTEPDPVRDRLGVGPLLAAVAPFAVIFGRAALRGCWALLRQAPDCGVYTDGLIRPQIVFSPFLAKQLDDVVIRAALAHERAHAGRRDPLRIWLAQLLTDLQWPWPAAQRRLESWLIALELARDEEARASGAAGEDLASAVLASMRFLRGAQTITHGPLQGTAFAHARLIGDAHVLRERVSRLLAPLSGPSEATGAGPPYASLLALLVLLLLALALGVVYGGPIMQSLLALTS